GDWSIPFAEMKALLQGIRRAAASPLPKAAQAAAQPKTAPKRQPSPQPPTAAGDDPLLLRSAFVKSDGSPRFVMPIPRTFLADAGNGYLARHETQFGGYEHPTRLFLDQHLRPGDLFIDVGAHWGLYALTASTLFPGEIPVLAIEPEPENQRHLQEWIIRNGVT